MKKDIAPCNEVHPEGKMKCRRAPNHDGDHRANGLAWSQDQIKSATRRIQNVIIGAVPPVPAYDPVNHPRHYTNHPSGIECIDITRHMNFNLGNAIKYIWRAGEKNEAIEDLRKAQWYIADEIKRLSD